MSRPSCLTWLTDLSYQSLFILVFLHIGKKWKCNSRFYKPVCICYASYAHTNTRTTCTHTVYTHTHTHIRYVSFLEKANILQVSGAVHVKSRQQWITVLKWVDYSVLNNYFWYGIFFYLSNVFRLRGNIQAKFSFAQRISQNRIYEQ